MQEGNTSHRYLPLAVVNQRSTALKLSKLDTAVKSPYPSSPYLFQLELDTLSQVLTWEQVVVLHETARELCPQRFSWWCSLPPEIIVFPQIDYVFPPPTISDLPNVNALRIDVRPNEQFRDLRILLTKEQLISLRKMAYRVRSDFAMYAKTQTLPTQFDPSA